MGERQQSAGVVTPRNMLGVRTPPSSGNTSLVECSTDGALCAVGQLGELPQDAPGGEFMRNKTQQFCTLRWAGSGGTGSPELRQRLKHGASRLRHPGA